MCSPECRMNQIFAAEPSGHNKVLSDEKSGHQQQTASAHLSTANKSGGTKKKNSVSNSNISNSSETGNSSVLTSINTASGEEPSTAIRRSSANALSSLSTEGTTNTNNICEKSPQKATSSSDGQGALCPRVPSCGIPETLSPSQNVYTLNRLSTAPPAVDDNIKTLSSVSVTNSALIATTTAACSLGKMLSIWKFLDFFGGLF